MGDVAAKFLSALSAFSFVIDKDGRIKSVSESWSRCANIPASDFVGRPLEEMLPPSTARLIHTSANRVRMFGFPSALSKTLEIAPGDIRHLHGEVFKIDEESIGFHAVDVSSLMEAQKLVETQRARVVQVAQFAALAQLAAGVAQEMNNPLAVIQGYAGVLRSHVSQGKLASEVVIHTSDKIVQMVGRITKIITGLQTFAREGERDPFESMQIHGLIEEVLDLTRERFDADGVKLEVRWRAEHSVVEGRQSQLVQVLMNLLDNARDACEAAQGEKWVRLEISEIEDNVVIAVEDSGPGIPPAIRPRMMEPFFSTKVHARKFGLGLSNAKMIVEQHGGVLTLRGDHPHTRFEIFLPKRVSGRQAG
jgi:C4-dicarboxylate-specific signal transduction histidine kinase